MVWLVRHGESMGNVADAQAQASGAGRLKLDVRDPDVELQPAGAGSLRVRVGDVAHALAVPDQPHHRRARSPVTHGRPRPCRTLRLSGRRLAGAAVPDTVVRPDRMGA